MELIKRSKFEGLKLGLKTICGCPTLIKPACGSNLEAQIYENTAFILITQQNRSRRKANILEACCYLRTLFYLIPF